MKQPVFVFGVSLLAACAAHPAKQPLYATDGSPACGNIGQTGRAPCELRAQMAPSAATVPQQVQHVALMAPSHRTPLLSPPARREELTVARPLVTQEDRAAAGNVMGKASPQQLEASARDAERHARRAARRAEAARIAAERAAHEARHDDFRWLLPVGAEDDLAAFEAEQKGRK